jgi:phosphatidylglycerophosphate synthase
MITGRTACKDSLISIVSQGKGIVNSQTPGKWDAAALTVLINVMLAGSAGVYLSTRSVAITLIASTAAVTLTTGVLALQRPRDAGRWSRPERRRRRR